MKPIFYKLLGYLQLFVGTGAVSGGLHMILNPDGWSQGISIEVLSNSPFNNFLIPGIVLISTIGVGSLLAAFFSLKLKREAGILGIILGSVLIVWILAQVYFIGLISWMQPLFGILGITEIILATTIYKSKAVE